MIKSAFLQELMFGRAGRSVGRRSDVFRDIQSRKSDSAAGVVNQDGLILLQSAHRDQQRPGGEIIGGDRSRLFES